MRRLLYYIVMFLVCGQAYAQTTFVLPAVPDTLRAAEVRAEYLLVHYWDNMDFMHADVKNVELEQAFADFVSVLSLGSEEAARAGVDRLMDRAMVTDSVYRHFASFAEKYLYDSDSPVANEQLYELFLEHGLASAVYSDAEKMRLRHQFESVRMNAPGTMASNFSYELADGTKGTLHDTAEGIPMLLLLYDPDCSHCRDMLFSLRYNSALNLRLRAGTIKVLAVYTEEDYDLWKSAADEIPAQWTVCTDRGMIKERNLYDLRKMPVLYLLDGDKRVALKNTTSKAVAEYLLDN